jgi:hypothetical protein
MMARPKGKRDVAEIKSAIEECMAGATLTSIAERRGVSQPTISYWLHKWGKVYYPTFKLRKQGRRQAVVPTKRDQRILKAIASGRTFGEVANKHRISRTRVASICKTWADRAYKVPVTPEG